MAAARCPTCSAEVALDSARCWLCGEEQPVLAEVVEPAPAAAGESTNWVLAGSLWLAVLASGLALLGLIYCQHPYFALTFALAAIPALAISFTGAALSRVLKKPWHPAIKIVVGASIAIVLLPVAAIIALCVACFDALGAFRGP